jgi:phosphate transport system protein
MPKHLEREIEKLKKMIISLSAVVEESVQQSIASIKNRDPKLARHVIETDYEIDRKEVEVEEECLKILALHQPVAIDLRYIIAVLKLNNDLERIGDLAVNIAIQADYLAKHEKVEIPPNLFTMTTTVRSMLKKSLDAMVNKDSELAYEVFTLDQRVDAIHREMFDDIQRAILSNPEQIDNLIRLLSISRHLERMADHATNIAEDVAYMLEGEIIRHWPGKYEQVSEK